MLKGNNVILRAIERDDLKRMHELARNVDLVLLGDGEWQPTPLAAFEKDFDKHLEREEKSWFTIEVGGEVIGGCGLQLGWAFRVQNWRRVWLTTLACNERAIRAYRKLGFVEEGRLREHAFFAGEYVDELQMGMLRSEWQAHQ